MQGSVRYWSPQLALLKDARGEHREAVLALSVAPSHLKFATASKDSTLKVGVEDRGYVNGASPFQWPLLLKRLHLGIPQAHCAGKVGCTSPKYETIY